VENYIGLHGVGKAKLQVSHFCKEYLEAVDSGFTDIFRFFHDGFECDVGLFFDNAPLVFLAFKVVLSSAG
jgi:hypothetical protein